MLVDPLVNSLNRRRIPPSQLVLSEVTPATRLLEKRRQQFEADERLEAAKAAYAEQVSSLAEKMVSRTAWLRLHFSCASPLHVRQPARVSA